MVYSFKILTDAGAPLAGATLSFYRGADLLTRLTTGAGGVVTLDPDADSGLLEPGNRVVASAVGYQSISVNSEALQPESEFWLLKNTTLSLGLIIGLAAIAYVIGQSIDKRKKIKRA